jgi:hypothetical protein
MLINMVKITVCHFRGVTHTNARVTGKWLLQSHTGRFSTFEKKLDKTRWHSACLCGARVKLVDNNCHLEINCVYLQIKC